ncbi:provisional ortholog of CDC42 effector protein 4 L homeolog [Xenopus laevis]|uniref:MGC81667 protein n=1 Tax=Xenopus laevis TaxID=8355 RepID=Q641G2_XENLA|nr:provisional ortholog of CDC42 effector protein 4 L homeolog [Xenopus laevis]AAH82375.1 MGC81667 protein [Xenopus laevis]
MPILKQSGSHSKKKSRIDRDMISAPLGDFRHTMHVGRGGDVFGDTSFLSNHGPSSASQVEAQAPKKNGLMTHGSGEQEESKMADSLSQISQSSGIGSGAGSVSSSPINNISSKEDNLWNSNVGQRDQLDWLSPGKDCGMKHAESILSFHLDLGPSILDEVLGVMDKDISSSDWNNTDDQFDFVYKCSSTGTADNEKFIEASLGETKGVHCNLSNTLPSTNLNIRHNSIPTSENPEANQSAYESDSEEEKRSIYEGIADDPESHDGQLHTSHRVQVEEDDDDDDDDDDEDAGQGYTFDEDLDDEIGV